MNSFFFTKTCSSGSPSSLLNKLSNYWKKHAGGVGVRGISKAGGTELNQSLQPKQVLK